MAPQFADRCSCFSRRARRGLTLMELVVVLLILVILGGLVVSNLSGVTKQTHLAKCSDTIWSLNNTWSQAYAQNIRYPDVYDSLLSSGGSALDARLTSGLRTQCSTTALTDPDVAALRSIGITRVVDLATVSLGGNVTDRAAPYGAAARVLASGGQVAQLNLTAHETAGNILRLKRHQLRQDDGSMADNRENVRYLVFGLGPNCTAVGAGKRLVEAPTHFGADDTINPATTYQRYLLVFSLVTDATGAVTANFEAAAGNDVTGPSSADAHIQQFHDAARNGG